MEAMEVEIGGDGVILTEEPSRVIKHRGGKKNAGKQKRSKNKRTMTTSGKKETFFHMPKFRCFSSKPETDTKGGFDMEVEDATGGKMSPTHLIILVNGLIGSAENWKYAAKQFLKRYPEDVIAHCSECNYSMLTFDGVDVMGERLAEEVISVIKRHPSVQKISFVGHSLGGLIARYAIGRLYERDITEELSQENGEYRRNGVEDPLLEHKVEGKIAGLEPVNFITSATPHLGSRGHNQVPLFCGVKPLEKVAARTSWCLGRSGKHLFLTDKKDGKPPLLLQMVNDSEDLKFISALQSFKRRVAYANVRFDSLVGWSTSSLRRKNELPKLKHLSREENYPHIINVETIQSPSPREELPLEAIASGRKKIDFEEEMIRNLTKMSWERVDVNFREVNKDTLRTVPFRCKTVVYTLMGLM
ncbi:putative lipase C4A8.10 [Pyrus x bretschneideri]|uniref:putative lipase C4A8.10 n=1 Tax=Pyrus x bretschneideri TaxID=225117 RepID=UPI0020309B1E|nr:putative lipase C4A8.10 [Pyrus x bretschneideri]